MRANPGGQLPPSEVIGRDRLIKDLWRVLERQSVVLTAERRMGKTSIIKKMVEECPPNVACFYRDLEGVHSLVEFVDIALQDVETHLSLSQRLAQKTRQLIGQLQGAEFTGIKIPSSVSTHWKTLLNQLISDLCAYQEKKEKKLIIFFWDEVPLMLQNLEQETHQAPMELLDVFRSLRQTHEQIRMVFTGSIGLHNLIAGYRQAGYRNDPTNDMDTKEVPPLDPKDATELTKLLLQGEGIRTDDVATVADEIARCVDRKPFFIHRLVEQLIQIEGVITTATVLASLEACMTNPIDPWHLNNYFHRITSAYTPADKPFAFAALDILAVSDVPVSLDYIFNQIKARITTEDKEKTQQTLALLQSDQYVLQSSAGFYSFRFPLIKRFWKLKRT